MSSKSDGGLDLECRCLLVVSKSVNSRKQEVKGTICSKGKRTVTQEVGSW